MLTNTYPNPYLPTPMHVLHAYYESTDQTLKTLELSFDNPQDSAAFFRKFNPGQFCQLSVFGKGESPIGVASAAWEGDFVRFTVQKMGAVTKALHKLQPGDPLGMRGPLGNGFPLEAWKGKNLVIIGAGLRGIIHQNTNYDLGGLLCVKNQSFMSVNIVAILLV